MMELLAPAGDRDALEAAVNAGADAVYLGLTRLNARRGAGNFDESALEAACLFCHERGVKVYVTVNTLVKDQEMDQLEQIAQALWRARADAAIVQDLGAAWALGRMLPELPLHASTQMAIHNRQGVAFLRKQGFARAILARELSYEEIAQCAGEGVPVEVFGHGALCVACSGQCLFSSLVGGRSGNRGLCAQPCRLPYRLEGPLCQAAGDWLSPKDLCTIDSLPRLAQAGVASLKLEGRLKGADYVYKVTSLYRLALDGEKVDPALLRQVFNRGYTQGYGPGVDDGELMSVPGEKHVLSGGGAWPGPRPRQISLTGRLTAQVGRPLALALSDGDSRVEAEGAEVQRARGKADPQRLAAQAGKMGGTPYRLEALRLEADPDAFASAAAVNALRRQALELLGQQRARRAAPQMQPPRPLSEALAALPRRAGPGSGEAEPRLCVQAADAALLARALAWGAQEAVWAPEDLTGAGLDRRPDFPFTLALPPTLSGDGLAALNQWALAQGSRIQGVLAANPAHLALNWPGEMRADGPMNLFNGVAAALLDMPYTPSPELTCAQIRALPGEKELVVYGRAVLMLLRHCPLNHCLGGGPHAACRRCDRGGAQVGQHQLVDRKGARFPLARLKTDQGCILRVYNSVPLMLLRRAGQLPPSARWRMVLTGEDQELCQALVICHRRVLDGLPLEGPHWDRIKDLPSTTGHYFRGVE